MTRRNMHNYLVHENEEDILTYEGWDNIHKAAYYNDYDMLLDELNNGACVNSISNNFISLYKPLFRKSRKIYFINMTPLYIAADRGHTKCVKLLYNRGADPTILTKNTYTNTELTALNIALYNGHIKCYSIMSGNSNKNTLLGDLNIK